MIVIILVREREIGYIAGMIDGEGSIFLWQNVTTKAKIRKTGYYYHPVVTITNCNLDVLKYLQNMIGGRIQIKKPIGNRKVGYALILGSNYIRKLIPLMENVLLIKSKQLQLMKEYISLIITKDNKKYNRYNPPSKDNLKRRDEIYFELKQLNKRGKD